MKRKLTIKPSRRPSLKRAIEWVAYNDDESESEVQHIAHYISTCLVADLWGFSPREIAKRISKIRRAGL